MLFRSDRSAEDARRQAILERLGWTVLRFSADEILRDADSVADGIYGYLKGNPVPTPTLPALRGGGLSEYPFL